MDDSFYRRRHIWDFQTLTREQQLVVATFQAFELSKVNPEMQANVLSACVAAICCAAAKSKTDLDVVVKIMQRGIGRRADEAWASNPEMVKLQMKGSFK